MKWLEKLEEKGDYWAGIVTKEEIAEPRRQYRLGGQLEDEFFHRVGTTTYRVIRTFGAARNDDFLTHFQVSSGLKDDPPMNYPSPTTPDVPRRMTADDAVALIRELTARGQRSTKRSGATDHSQRMKNALNAFQQKLFEKMTFEDFERCSRKEKYEFLKNLDYSHTKAEMIWSQLHGAGMLRDAAAMITTIEGLTKAQSTQHVSSIAIDSRINALRDFNTSLQNRAVSVEAFVKQPLAEIWNQLRQTKDVDLDDLVAALRHAKVIPELRGRSFDNEEFARSL